MWYSTQQDDNSPSRTIGLIGRFHRTLNSAIMCHADKQWTQALPLVLGISTAYKEDLVLSATEPVYGEPLLVPG